MALRESYHFSRRLNRCAVTDIPFEDGQVIYTAIFFGFKEEGYLRKDYSTEGWNNRPDEDQLPFSSWKSKWKKTAKVESDQRLEKNNAESLLHRLSADDKPETETTRYILALMLERSKVIAEESSQNIKEGILRAYRHKKSDELFLVKDPQLSLDEIVGLQEEVIGMLDTV